MSYRPVARACARACARICVRGLACPCTRSLARSLASPRLVRQADGRGGYTMQWEYAGSQCTGTYQASIKTAVLHLSMPASSVTITYRVLDANTMAVCIVEVDTAHTPTIQYGHMNRIERKYLDMLTT